MKVIVAGSRTFNDYDYLKEKLDYYFQRLDEITIVCGEAKGADTLGRRYAEENGYPVLSYPADWNKYGKSAGYKRNEEMLKNADALVAFWDGRSPGTKNMIDITKSADKPIRIVKI